MYAKKKGALDKQGNAKMLKREGGESGMRGKPSAQRARESGGLRGNAALRKRGQKQSDDQQAGQVQKVKRVIQVQVLGISSNHNYLSHIMVSTTIVSQGAASDKVVTWRLNLPCCGAVGRFVRGGPVWRWSGAGVANARPGRVAGHGGCEVLRAMLGSHQYFWRGMGWGGCGGAWVVTRHRETRTVGVTVRRDSEMAWLGWR
ncbi:hypothetical protein EDB85DRAFT_1899319 [Lactarius pseudohatsudake]|nr:hypothetical protein EDB85DRAFT_1899319 [Lactarius pseudohatsudake]